MEASSRVQGLSLLPSCLVIGNPDLIHIYPVNPSMIASTLPISIVGNAGGLRPILDLHLGATRGLLPDNPQLVPNAATYW